MRVEIYVQARMGSTRLPGKVLKPVLGQPMLHYLMERLQKSQEADNVIILTSTNKEDDAIEAFCCKHSYPCFRGSALDVLERYYQAALERQPEAIVRINGDCPLIDPCVVDDVIRAYKKGSRRWDYVSNTIKRTFPRGLDTEIFSYKALAKTHALATKEDEREHVTLFMYRHPELFRLHNIASAVDESHHRWTLDTIEDFQLLELIITALFPQNPQFQYEDILKLLKEHPEWMLINAHVQQKPV